MGIERQELNLYTPEFRIADQPLSAQTMLRGAIVVFCLLIVVEALVAWQWYYTEQELVVQQQRQKDIAAKLAKARQSQPASQREQLETEINLIRSQIARREQLKKIIGGQYLGNFQGFSAYLQAIARQVAQDIALTKVSVLDAGSYVEFAGWTRKADAVPSYLSRLRSEDSFAKVKFGVLKLDRESEFTQLRFSIAKPVVE